MNTQPDTCACCGVALGGNWIETYDYRRWCTEHGGIALELEREAHKRGDLRFVMPGPVLLWARNQVQKNNRRRFGP